MTRIRLRDLPRVLSMRVRHGDWRGVYTRSSTIDPTRLAPDWFQVLALAEAEMRSRGNEMLKTEHLVLGLLSVPDGPIADVFRHAGIDQAHVKAIVDERVAAGTTVWSDQRSTNVAGRGPRFVGLSAGVIDVQERAFKLAIEGGASEATAAHLLAAVLLDRTSTGRRLLRRAGVDLRRLRKAVLGAAPSAR